MHGSPQRGQIALALHDDAQFQKAGRKSREDEVQSFAQAQDSPQGNQEIAFISRRAHHMRKKPRTKVVRGFLYACNGCFSAGKIIEGMRL